MTKTLQKTNKTPPLDRKDSDKSYEIVKHVRQNLKKHIC